MGRPLARIDPIHLETLAQRLSDEEIAVELGFARVTVTSARKRLGIPSFTASTGLKRRDGACTHGGRRRRLFFNEHFFANLSSEAAAYFLGLIAADGSVGQQQDRLEITLAEPDEHLLFSFLECLDARNCRIVARRRQDRSKTFHRLTLCSKAMAGDLVSWGLTPRKTEAFSLARPIPPDLVRHFVRGFWDGDGSIGSTHFEVGVRSEPFARQLRSMIAEVGGERPPLRPTTTRAGKPFFVMAVASKRFELFRQELYRDACFYMARKYKRFEMWWC